MRSESESQPGKTHVRGPVTLLLPSLTNEGFSEKIQRQIIYPNSKGRCSHRIFVEINTNEKMFGHTIMHECIVFALK